MKAIIMAMVLLISTTGSLLAQTNKTDQSFQVPENFAFGKKFMIDLGKGNKAIVEYSDYNDIERFSNIDSILRLFIADLAPIRDSLRDAGTSKKIEQITNAGGRRKIRYQQFAPHGTSFVKEEDGLAPLKIEQDTIIIIGVVRNPPPASTRFISRYDPRYFKLSFFLNDFEEIATMMDGRLNEKIKTYIAHQNEKWTKPRGPVPYHLKADPSISADQPRAHFGGPGDFLSFQLTVQAQNYKQYFVPAFGLGSTLTLSNRERQWKHEIGLMWEPNFLFARNAQNKLETFRNDFLTLTYGQGPVKEKDPRKTTEFTGIVSIGYLIYRKGDYYERNTFRIGAGRMQVRKTSIEPGFYFHDLFRGVTPCIRILQYF